MTEIKGMNIWKCKNCGNEVRSKKSPGLWRIVPDGDGKEGCPGDEWNEHKWFLKQTVEK